MQLDADFTSLSMHPTETHQLLALLDEQGVGSHAEERDCVLTSAYEKIADAAALARWLRDHVSLDLDTAEAVELLALISSCTTPLACSEPISSIYERLEKQVACLN